MRPAVIFEALSLLSERDLSAKAVTFGPRENLLLGENETGKSRIIKHIFWTLGCEVPKRAAGSFDSNVIARLVLTLGTKRFILVRQNRMRGVFDAEGVLLFATASASRWSEYFAQIFNYPLKLQRHEEGVFGFAGPTYALLPYYIDQDASWSTTWATFSSLSQFVGWQKPVFDAFTGLKPLAYLEVRLKRDELTARMRELKRESKAQNTSYARVVAMLPAQSVTIDEAVFEGEIRALAADVEKLSELQERIREELVKLAGEREQAMAELRLAKSAEQEIFGDVAYLADIPDASELECPTCGTRHVASFHARLELADEAQTMHRLVLRLQGQFDGFRARESTLKAELVGAARQLGALREKLDRRNGSNSIADVVTARSRHELKLAFEGTIRDTQADIDALEEKKAEADEFLAKFDEKTREKRVKEFFAEELTSFGDALGVNSVELGSRRAIGKRPPSGGSSGPRAILAMHLSHLSTNREYGFGSVFPLVVDTPQQSGQDPANLTRMMNVAFDGSGSIGQVLIATESLPAGWNRQSSKVLQFADKRKLLSLSEFVPVAETVAPLMKALTTAIELERIADATEDQSPDDRLEDESAGEAEPDGDNGTEDRS